MSNKLWIFCDRFIEFATRMCIILGLYSLFVLLLSVMFPFLVDELSSRELIKFTTKQTYHLCPTVHTRVHFLFCLSFLRLNAQLLNLFCCSVKSVKMQIKCFRQKFTLYATKIVFFILSFIHSILQMTLFVMLRYLDVFLHSFLGDFYASLLFLSIDLHIAICGYWY